MSVDSGKELFHDGGRIAFAFAAILFRVILQEAV